MYAHLYLDDFTDAMAALGAMATGPSYGGNVVPCGVSVRLIRKRLGHTGVQLACSKWNHTLACKFPLMSHSPGSRALHIDLAQLLP